MTPILVDGSTPGADSKARDWAEIQERMLVPLYEAVYDRLEVGHGTRLLALGCGSGLALLMAAARGAAVSGCDPDEGRLALARERLTPERRQGAAECENGDDRPAALLAAGLCPAAPPGAGCAGYSLITSLDPSVPASLLLPALGDAVAMAQPGTPVVLAGWGPGERCATSRVLRIAERLAEPGGPAARTGPGGPGDLEDLVREAGLEPDGSGRVSCPFGYPDMDSAVRGLVSTGLFDAAVAATDLAQVEKEVTEALHAFRRPDGTIRMENVFRYVVARGRR